MIHDCFQFFRLLTEDPHQRLGAGGASEVSVLTLPLTMSAFHCLVICGALDGLNFYVHALFQVKEHMFFKDINWDTLARQKVMQLLLSCLPCYVLEYID